MGVLLTKHGFNIKLSNVEHLEAIYDLIEGKWSYQKIDSIFGRNCYYFVYTNKKDIFTKEVLEHQKFLSKKFWCYKNHRIKEKFMGAYSIDEFKKLVEEDKKQVEKFYKKQERPKENLDKGVYGIYYNDKLIYIGKTDVSFNTRFKQHQEALTSGSTSQYLYKYLLNEKQLNGNIAISFKPLITIKDLKIEDVSIIKNRDIEAMELALIHLYKPICNIQGIKQDYKFTYGG